MNDHGLWVTLEGMQVPISFESRRAAVAAWLLIEEWLILEGCNESGFVAKLDAVKECSREKRVRTLAQGFEEVAGGYWGP